MSDLANKEDGFLEFIHRHGLAIDNHGMGLDIPKPFEREIYLFDTYVAGTTHIEDMEDIEPTLLIGNKLIFFREPDNQYDPQAIKVETTDGQKIGYIPQQDNLIFSRLMDAGKLLFGKIHSKEIRGDWVKLEMRIYLYEG